ncbi:CsbD family protein, partial [Methylobacterium sp. WL122]
MNRDEFRGAKRHLKGRAQTTLGGLTGDAGR